MISPKSIASAKMTTVLEQGRRDGFVTGRNTVPRVALMSLHVKLADVKLGHAMRFACYLQVEPVPTRSKKYSWV